MRVFLFKIFILLNLTKTLLGFGQMSDSSGPYSYNSPEKSMRFSSENTLSKGDKELEDTIREINRYTLSDSLWKMWRAVEDSQFVIAKSDSIESKKIFFKGAMLAKEASELIGSLKSIEHDSLLFRKTKIKAILLLEKSRKHLEKTFKLNPFDMKTQTYLIWIFQSLADLYANCDNNIRAINMLEYLTYILHDDQTLFFKL